MASFLSEYGGVENFNSLLESQAEPPAEDSPPPNPAESHMKPTPKSKPSVSSADLLKALRMQRYQREQRAAEQAHQEDCVLVEVEEEEEEETEEEDAVVQPDQQQQPQQPAQQHVQPAQQPAQQHVQPAQQPAQHVQPAQQPPQQQSGDLQHSLIAALTDMATEFATRQEEIRAAEAHGLRSYRAAEAAIRAAAAEVSRHDVDTAVAAYNMAEADFAAENLVRWQDRGPRGDGRPTVWRGQNWRAGSARYANRGGQRRAEFAAYFAAKAKAKGKGQSKGSAELSSGSGCKGKGKHKGKPTAKGAPRRDAAAPYPASQTVASQPSRQRLMYLFCSI